MGSRIRIRKSESTDPDLDFIKGISQKVQYFKYLFLIGTVGI